MMKEIISNKDEIFNILKNQKKLTGRILFRTSRFYNEIIKNTNHPAFSSDPTVRACFICCALSSNKIPNEIIKHEYNFVSDGCIPLFKMNLSNGEIYTANGIKIETFDATYTFNSFKRKFYKLTNDAEEVIFQKKLMDLSLEILFPSTTKKINNKTDMIDATVKFMSGDSFHYMKNESILNVKHDINGMKTICKMNSDIYNGLSGATIMQFNNQPNTKQRKYPIFFIFNRH